MGGAQLPCFDNCGISTPGSYSRGVLHEAPLPAARAPQSVAGTNITAQNRKRLFLVVQASSGSSQLRLGAGSGGWYCDPHKAVATGRCGEDATATDDAAMGSPSRSHPIF